MWTIYLRDPLLQRIGVVGDYQTFDAWLKFNALGTWALDLDARVTAAGILTQVQYGIEVVRDGAAVISGPVTKITRRRDKDSNRILVEGHDDMVWLADRLVSPQPASTVPPYSTNEHDVRTDLCSSVLRYYADRNTGINAIAPRKTYSFDIEPTDPLLGSTITARGRWQNLLQFMAERALEGGGLGFRVVQKIRVEGPVLELEVYQPEDKTSSVTFSIANGTMASYEYDQDRSEVNYVVVGGGGEGTARTIAEHQDPTEIVRYRRIEKFADRRDTTAVAELAQEGTKTLGEGKGKASLTFVPIDVAGTTYLTDYRLGDKVSAVIDDVTITEVIRQMHISLTPQSQRLFPTIGTPGSHDIARFFDRLRRAETRLNQLERR